MSTIDPMKPFQQPGTGSSAAPPPFQRQPVTQQPTTNGFQQAPLFQQQMPPFQQQSQQRAQQAPHQQSQQQPQQQAQYGGYNNQPRGQAFLQQRQHPHQNQHQQQPQHQQQQPSVGNNFGATMSNEFNQLGATMGVNPLVMGVTTAGIKTAGERVQRYIPGLSGLWQALRYHFHVDNMYMRNKMKLLLFPRQPQWSRVLTNDPGESNRFQPPVADVNAPDLYLPVMSFITFSLLAGLLQGILGKFDPAYIQSMIMFSATLMAFEAAAARLGCMALKISNISLLDFLCYSGYRYFGLCLILLVECATSGMALPYYLVLVWVGIANVLFLLQALRASVQQAQRQTPDVNKQGATLLVLVFAGLQFLFMWWLSAYNMDALGYMSTTQVSSPLHADMMEPVATAVDDDVLARETIVGVGVGDATGGQADGLEGQQGDEEDDVE